MKYTGVRRLSRGIGVRPCQATTKLPHKVGKVGTPCTAPKRIKSPLHVGITNQESTLEVAHILSEKMIGRTCRSGLSDHGTVNGGRSFP